MSTEIQYESCDSASHRRRSSAGRGVGSYLAAIFAANLARALSLPTSPPQRCINATSRKYIGSVPTLSLSLRRRGETQHGILLCDVC